MLCSIVCSMEGCQFVMLIITLPMQLSELFVNVLSCPRQLKVQSRQDFFATKHRQKRMKKSTCFSEQIEKEQHELDTTHASLSHDLPFASCCNELESTFGEENVLTFRPKPPKRKRNIRNQQHQQKKEESSEQSDSDSSTRNSQLFQRKTAETFKSHLQLLRPNPATISTLSIANFKIIGKIGEGTYSEVFKAVERRTGFVCALKVLEKQKMREMNVQENVVREIKIHMYLQHPNIARLYGCFHDAAHIYLIEEYCTDQNLYEAMKQPRYQGRKQLPHDKATQLVTQISEAVRYIHKNAIIHRDIKPENILLTMNSSIKICDFGWSIYNPSKEMRLTLCGTPLYLAPEMVSQNQYDQSIDIWALGVITYQLLTEESPFKITQLRDLTKIIHEEIDLTLICSSAARDFIRCAMEKDPSKRKSIFQLVRHPFLALQFQSNM